MVLSDFGELIQSVNLGAGTEAAITEGRRRIRQHLNDLTDEQRAYFDALIDEDQLQSHDKPLRAQMKSVVHSLFSASDWMRTRKARAESTGQAATDAIQNHWSEFIQSSKIA